MSRRILIKDHTLLDTSVLMIGPVHCPYAKESTDPHNPNCALFVYLHGGQTISWTNKSRKELHQIREHLEQLIFPGPLP